jgi:hypothetical protein
MSTLLSMATKRIQVCLFVFVHNPVNEADFSFTGRVPLLKSKSFKDPFESGHTDEFEIEAMDIGEPRKIKHVKLIVSFQ